MYETENKSAPSRKGDQLPPNDFDKVDGVSFCASISREPKIERALTGLYDAVTEAERVKLLLLGAPPPDWLVR